ncbi:uncharacterized protein BJ212DRAFT_1484350 [Suillus subaureus]|uniref:Uncharacterized protein n=1 Tax=Suillus subaureus TaxID=48587 RepID=A0A9P7J9F2_9AGAM|nr:uncharacterized protein BJ212DRAFT_1484350 [Suillus subaureus]KAG1809644.1 hypothetical protein BJ212DRAFT_1484350 [Suillus subaureus]
MTNTETVKDAVYKTWSEEGAHWEIGKILAESDIPYEEKDSATWELIKMLWVECIDYKDRKAMVASMAIANSRDLFRSRVSRTEKLKPPLNKIGYDNPCFLMVILEDTGILTTPLSTFANTPQPSNIPGPGSHLPRRREGGPHTTGPPLKDAT